MGFVGSSRSPQRSSKFLDIRRKLSYISMGLLAVGLPRLQPLQASKKSMSMRTRRGAPFSSSRVQKRPYTPSISPRKTRSHWAWDWWAKLGSPKWVCSPMVDQSERAFRLLCRRYGVSLAYTPMIHAEPFAANEAYRNEYFDAWVAASLRGDTDADRPLVAQLGGDDPQTVLRAARLLEPYVDAIDLNFGCPTEDARKGGHKHHSPRCRRYGAYLLTDLPLMQRLVGTTANGLRQVPVTAKIRLLESLPETLEVACALEQAGAAALCVHGRTVRQRPKYISRDPAGSGGAAASWGAIATVRQAVSLPVIANGGVETCQDAVRCLEQTGAAAVMSAESLLENPDLFHEPVKSVALDARHTVGEVERMLRLAREYVDLVEEFPCPLEYPPTKSHLFKILHRLLGTDQAEARRREAAGLPLDLQSQLKLSLMKCPVRDLAAIRASLDFIESRCMEEESLQLGPSWYRRWRTPATSVKQSASPSGVFSNMRRQGVPSRMMR